MLLFLEDATTFNRQFPLDPLSAQVCPVTGSLSKWIVIVLRATIPNLNGKKNKPKKMSGPVDSMRSASHYVPDQVLIAIKGSCMKECAWPCSHDCHTLNK